MVGSRLLYLLGAVALAGCEARSGANDGEAVGITAEAGAEENLVTVKAPGIDIKVDLPESVRNRSSVEGNDELLYPSSKVAGIRVDGSGDKQGVVELRFSSSDAPGKIADWYLDPARTRFKIDSDTREGSTINLAGHETGDNSRFTLRLKRKSKGTDGLLTILN